MTFHKHDTQHLLKMLGDALFKEQELWKPVNYKSVEGAAEVGGIHRDEAIRWIISLNCRFHFSPETVALSIAMIDRFLNRMKARPKYLQCIAISCLYIAAKTLEEDEVIPSIVDLIKTSRCGCSVSDVLRMEGIVLNKLNWRIKTVTPIDFLHIIHSLMMCYYPQLLEDVANMTPSRHLSILTRNMFHCVCNHKMVKFRPITLTLAVMSLELEQITPNWLTIINTVQKLADIEVTSLRNCREIAGHILRSKNMLPTGYQFKSKMPADRNALVRNKSIKRKAEQVDLEDDVYDGIKRLYNEDSHDLVLHCGSEVKLDGDSPSGVMAPHPEVAAN